MRQRQSAGEEHRVDVDRHYTAPFVRIEIGRTCERADTCVVDQDIEPAEALDGDAHHGFDIRAL